MDEYAALAQRVVLTMDDVHGCLVLSRDGLVLGAFPEDEEASVKPAWLRFVHVGDARRSFVEFGDQTWAYIHRGPYAAFVLAGTAVRPGVLLDQLEQALLVAEETRAKRDTLKVPDAPSAPSGRPRTSLHPPAERPQPIDVSTVPVAHDQPAAAAEATAVGRWRPPPVGGGVGGGGAPPDPTPTSAGEPEAPSGPFAAFRRSDATADAADATAPAFAASPFAELAGLADGDDGSSSADGPPEMGDAGSPPDEPGEATDGSGAGAAVDQVPSEATAEDTSEIDRVLLAKEFSGLLQMGADDDEAPS